MQNRNPTVRPVLDFTPVPRRHRVDGWTAERQRAFIVKLAELGSVKAAARAINMSAEGAYALRRQPGAESFAAAWDAAITHGVQNLADIAMERAVDGVPVPVYWKGEQVGERRLYNDRLLMFMLRHHLPEKFGALKALPPGTKHPDTLAREAAEAAAAADPAGDEAAALAKAQEDMARLLHMYRAKVSSERLHRLNGQTVVADFCLRQLTHLEVFLDLAGYGQLLVTAARETAEQGEPEIWCTEWSERLDYERRQAWAAIGEPDRPPLRFTRPPHPSREGGPTARDRDKVRSNAERKMAYAQQEWEAAATEEAWAEWMAEG